MTNEMRKLMEVFNFNKIDQADIKDAIDVFGDWMLHSSRFDLQGNVNRYFKNLPIEEIDIDKLNKFQDYGRTVSAENLDKPIIAMKMPDSDVYQILDGTHRYLIKKRQGIKTISVGVVNIPWKHGIKKKGKRTYFI